MERQLAVTLISPYKLALVGVGKIARDQHLPSIAENPAFALEAAVSRNANVEGIDNFKTFAELLETGPIFRLWRCVCRPR